MLYLDQAIVTRWNAKGLNASIGTLWADDVPELTPTPYAVFDNISDTKLNQSYGSTYQTALVQIQVYDQTKEAVGAWCELIEPAFKYSNFAASNPFAIVGTGSDFILSSIPTSPYILVRLGDTVWQGTMTFTITYRRDGGLRPS